MGSGKSTLGPIVANVLGYDFIDLDRAIAERAGQSVQQIFANAGEQAFRKLEAEALRASGAQQEVIVAVGGGALTSEENLVWALTHGLVVYLRVPPEVLARRLRRGRSVRPLLLDDEGRRLSAAALRQRVQGLLARREHYYRRAQLVVELGDRRIGVAVDEVVKALRRHGRGRTRR